jgi:hypothetical protein
MAGDINFKPEVPAWVAIVIAALAVSAYVYVHAPRSTSTPPTPAPPVAQEPAPQPKKVEGKKAEQPKKVERTKVEPKKVEAANVTGSVQLVPMPCIENVAGITKAVEADDNHEHNFKVLFGPRTACVTLKVTGCYDEHFEFKTASFFRHSPTIYVKPASPDDLTKCRIGDKFKVEGAWERYLHLPFDGPDRILIIEARLTKVEE